tara:strand:+ start:3053 stop:3280 length:228 start_codon:yes stop_codon:yes gene_type:complete
MKFSMDGFRDQLSNDTRALKEIVGAVIRGEHYDEKDLVEAVNEVITKSNVLNCVYQEGDPLFNDMSEVSVEPIEI